MSILSFWRHTCSFELHERTTGSEHKQVIGLIQKVHIQRQKTYSILQCSSLGMAMKLSIWNTSIIPTSICEWSNAVTLAVRKCLLSKPHKCKIFTLKQEATIDLLKHTQQKISYALCVLRNYPLLLRIQLFIKNREIW